MEIIIQPSPEAATEIAARIFDNLLRGKPGAVLGLATGSTPLLLYRKLVSLRLDWSGVTTFNLDEYVGLAPEHPASYRHFMTEHFFKHVNVPPENVHIPADKRRTFRWRARNTRTISGGRAGSTCSCSASARTGTSASTSKLPRWFPARASRR